MRLSLPLREIEATRWISNAACGPHDPPTERYNGVCGGVLLSSARLLLFRAFTNGAASRSARLVGRGRVGFLSARSHSRAGRGESER